jgi:hypothetical protein
MNESAQERDGKTVACSPVPIDQTFLCKGLQNLRGMAWTEWLFQRGLGRANDVLH